MKKDIILQSFFSQYKFLFAKSVVELCVIIYLASKLSPVVFGKGMVVVTLTYLLLVLTLSKSMDAGYVVISGISVAIILFGLSFLYPSMAIFLRIAILVSVASSFRNLIEIKYKLADEVKAYKAAFVGQLIGAIALVLGLVTFKDSWLIPASYAIIEISALFFLLKGAKPKFGRLRFSQYLSEFRNNLRLQLSENSLSVLMLITALLSVEAYSYLFLSVYIGLFFYRNVTMVAVSKFKDYFKDVKGDELRVDVIHIIGYVSLIVVLSSVLIPMSYDFSLFIGWPYMADTLIVLILAGIIKGIFGVYRLIVKSRISEKIGLLELIALMLCSIIAVSLVGVHGIAVAIFISYLVSFFLYQMVIEKKFKQDISITSRDYFYIVLSGGISAISVALIKELFAANGILSFIFLVVFGTAVYYILTFILNQNLYRRFIRFMFESFEKQ
ncbi:MAG: hypothetical protein ABIJ34_08795 [archaeon]